jgi:hypothetical protein
MLLVMDYMEGGPVMTREGLGERSLKQSGGIPALGGGLWILPLA